MYIDKNTLLFHDLTDEEASELRDFGERLMLKGDVSEPPVAVQKWMEEFDSSSQRFTVITSVLPSRIFYSLLLHQEGGGKPKFLSEAHQTLDRFGSYKPGWDGYHAQPFSQDLLSAVRETLHLCEKMFTLNQVSPNEVILGPAPDGTIDMEVSYSDRCFILLFDTNHDRSVIYYEDVDTGIYSSTQVEAPSLEVWFNWLLGEGSLPSGEIENV